MVFSNFGMFFRKFQNFPKHITLMHNIYFHHKFLSFKKVNLVNLVNASKNENFEKWPKNSWSPPKKYLETCTNTTMLFLGPFDPPKGPKTGMPKMYPLMGHTHKNKLLSCSIHHFELPCKKSAQTDKQFWRYSIFKILGIWLAMSFLAILRAKKLKIVISLQRI